MRLTRNRIEYLLVIGLIVLMPLHYVVFSLLLSNYKVLSLWRDAFIVLLLILSCKGGKLKLNRTAKLISLVCGMVLLFVFTNISGLSINVARTYIFPMLVYLPVSRMKFSENELDGMVRTLWVVTVIIAIYGIVQAYVLGPSFLINLGYSSTNGRLTSSSFYIMNNWSQQRITGTFVSPNNCGCYFAMALIVLYNLRGRNKLKAWIYFSGLAIIVLALIGTLSRSAWVGCIVGLLITKKKIDKRKNIQRGFVIVLLVVAVIYIVDRFVLGGRIGAIALQHVNNTVQRSDSSMIFHIKQLYEPFIELIYLPFGYSFGTNGSFALQGLPISEVHLVESSIYTIGYEFGILLTSLFFLPYASIIVHSGKNSEGKAVKGIAICLLLIYCILPSIQAYEQPFYLFLFAGAFISKKNELLTNAIKSKSKYSYQS